MTSHVTSQEGRPAALSRGARLLVRYFMWLVVIPQVILGLGLLLVRYAEWIYAVITIPLLVYCAPVAAVFGNTHFITHATLCPSDLVGWALLVVFYTASALLIATLHALVTLRRGIAEP